MPEAEPWYVEYLMQIVIAVAVPILGGLGWLIKRWLDRRVSASAPFSHSFSLSASRS